MVGAADKDKTKRRRKSQTTVAAEGGEGDAPPAEGDAAQEEAEPEGNPYIEITGLGVVHDHVLIEVDEATGTHAASHLLLPQHLAW
jgi:hypothetical protein